MIRTIIKPTKNSLTIRLPDNLIGKMVEVLAFELETPKVDETITADKEKRIKLNRFFPRSLPLCAKINQKVSVSIV